MYCKKCGAELKEGAKFCSQCGNQVEQNTNQNTEHNIPDSNEEKGKGRLPVAGILAILALVICFVAVIFFRDNGKVEQEVAADLSGEKRLEQVRKMAEAMEQMGGDTDDVEEDEENSQGQGNAAESVKADAGYYDFNKTVLIGFGFEMLLKPDGTIVARGANGNGELGNGTLLDSEEWIMVEGLSDAKQIGTDGNTEEEEGGTVYALKNG